MPVIGRLDKQVDDVLITPAGRNSSRDDESAPTRDDAGGGRARHGGARGDSPATREPVAGERAAAERGEGAHEDRQSPAGRRSREDERLPVWLL